MQQGAAKLKRKIFPPYKKFKVIVYFPIIIFPAGCESVYFNSKQIALSCREATKKQQGRDKMNESDEQAMDGGWKDMGMIAEWNENIRDHTMEWACGNIYIKVVQRDEV